MVPKDDNVIVLWLAELLGFLSPHLASPLLLSFIVLRSSGAFASVASDSANQFNFS